MDFVNADWDETIRLIEEKGLKRELGKLAYPVAKRALNYFSAQLADELAGRKIRVNVLLPGSTDTGMTDDFVQSLGSMERLVQYTGGGRLATPGGDGGAYRIFGQRDGQLYLWCGSGSGLCSECGNADGTKARYVFTKKKVMGEIT